MNKSPWYVTIAAVIGIALIGCNPKSSESETSESFPSAILVDSATLVGFYLELPIASLATYDREARKKIISNQEVNEQQGYLSGQISAEFDNFTIRIQKLKSDDAIAVHSSGLMGGGEFGSDDFEVFHHVNDQWELNSSAVSEINLLQFYESGDIPDAPTYTYALEPVNQQLQVTLTIPDHYLPHMTGDDSASQAFLKVLESNKYSDLVMQWDSLNHKFSVVDKKLKKTTDNK